MPSDPVRVAIHNDFEIVVAGLATILQPFSSRVEVVELTIGGQPVSQQVDVVLHDTFGQQHDSLDVSRDVAQQARLLVFSWASESDLVQDAIRAGAAGFVSKQSTAVELVEAIEAVAAGRTVMPGPEPRTAETNRSLGRWPGEAFGLSPRESEVLALLCEGLSNEEIAERAYIGVNTVKTHIRTMYRKIGVTSRTQAVVWGHNHHFDPGPPQPRP